SAGETPAVAGRTPAPLPRGQAGREAVEMRPLEGAEKITFGQTDEDWPSISTDGRWLLHTENHERGTALVRMDLTSAEQQTLRIDSEDFREPVGKLRLVLRDAYTGEPLVARISVKQQGGKFQFPL